MHMHVYTWPSRKSWDCKQQFDHNSWTQGVVSTDKRNNYTTVMVQCGSANGVIYAPLKVHGIDAALCCQSSKKDHRCKVMRRVFTPTTSASSYKYSMYIYIYICVYTRIYKTPYKQRTSINGACLPRAWAQRRPKVPKWIQISTKWVPKCLQKVPNGRHLGEMHCSHTGNLGIWKSASIPSCVSMNSGVESAGRVNKQKLHKQK